MISRSLHLCSNLQTATHTHPYSPAFCCHADRRMMQWASSRCKTMMIDWLKDNLTRRRHLYGYIANELRNTYPLSSVGIAADDQVAVVVVVDRFLCELWSLCFVLLSLSLCWAAVHRMKEESRWFSLILSLLFLLIHAHTCPSLVSNADVWERIDHSQLSKQ